MDKIWWNSVPNARRFIEDITNKISNEESLVYSINNYFPWYETFTSIIFDNTNTSEKTLKTIDIDGISDIAPGRYILDKFFKPELKEKYRSSIGFERFIAENDHSSVIKNSIMLVKCSNEKAVTEWVNFVSGYVDQHDPNTPMCCFLIENSSKIIPASGLTSFSVDDYFQKYDIDIFSLLVISSIKNENKENALIKRYSAELASLLAGNDIELAANLAVYGTKLAFHTDFVVKEVINKKSHSNYCDFNINDDINQIIREAQIKIFFPEIENFRTHFICKYSDSLPSTDALKVYISDLIDDISCLELGNLKYLCDSKRIDVNPFDYSDLKFYRECRNKLAHTTVLSENEIKKLSKQHYKNT